MCRAPRLGAILVSLLIPLAASGASFVVPADRDLVTSSDAVVVGRVLSHLSRMTGDGLIVTDHLIRVDDALKGGVIRGETIVLTEVGGVVGDIGLISSAAPRFVDGARALVFLAARSDGSWSTHAAALGKFDFVRDSGGALLVVRSAREEEIFGWDVYGAPHVEATRDAVAFLDYVRAVARGEVREVDYVRVPEGSVVPEAEGRVESHSNFSANAYLMQFGFATPGGARWPAKGFTMAVQGSPTGGTAASVAQAAAATWNDDPTSDIAIAISGSTSAINYGKSNNANVVHFGVSSTFSYTDDEGKSQTPLSGNVVGQALLWATSQQNELRGERFYTSAECDVVVESSLSGAVLAEVTAHELGHCLGLRHSDDGPPPNTEQALMNSSVSGRGAQLLDWDREAANAVYGDGTYNSCVAPTLLAHTHSRTIGVGQSLQLAVLASGATSYQWYRGTTGTETQPIAGATSSVYDTGALFSTASYWVKASSSCGSVSSETITVTVSPSATSSRRRVVERP